MARRLWSRRKASAFAADGDLVFASGRGTPLLYRNIYRAFKPAAVRAGVPWAGLHTLRHTCATALFREGLNAKQVERGWAITERRSRSTRTSICWTTRCPSRTSSMP
jgi:integrase